VCTEISIFVLYVILVYNLPNIFWWEWVRDFVVVFVVLWLLLRFRMQVVVEWY